MTVGAKGCTILGLEVPELSSGSGMGIMTTVAGKLQLRLRGIGLSPGRMRGAGGTPGDDMSPAGFLEVAGGTKVPGRFL